MTPEAVLDPVEETGGEFQAPQASQVGRLARTGAAWSFGLVLTRHLVSLLTTAVLARLLAPSVFGLLGMVATLTVLLQVIADGGLSWATIQRRSLTRVQVDTLFWVNAASGVALWVLCILSGPALRSFYGAAEVPAIAAVLGLGFVFSGIALQPAALLQRQMRYREMFLAETAGQACAAVVGIWMALDGFGYWALVGQALCGQAVRCAGYLWGSGYRPHRPQWTVETRGLLAFGGYLAASGLVIYVSRNLDNILIGRFWGTTELGYYTRAYFLMTLPSLVGTTMLAPIMVSALSAFQHDPERFGRAYRKAVTTTSFIGLPLAAGLLVTAPEAVRLVYGPRWLPVVPMLTWLCLASLTQPLYNTVGWLLVSRGKARAMFVMYAVVAAVLGVGFGIGVRWGGVGVAAAYALLMTVVVTLPMLHTAHRLVDLPLSATVRAVAPVFGITLVMAAAAWSAGAVAAQSGASWQWTLVAKVITGVVAYAGLGQALLKPSPFDLVPRPTWRFGSTSATP